MAATALAVLSLAAAKAELRIAPDEHDHNDLILAQIRGAVSYVSRFLRAPLVDRAETHHCAPPGADRPLALLTDYVQSTSAVRYWSAGTALREEPDGLISVADLGRLVQVGRGYCVWPPEDGWPEVETGSMLEIDLTRSIPITAQTQSLRDAVVVVMRHLYNAEGELNMPRSTIQALIAPWRRLDADAPGTLVTVLDEAPTPAPAGPYYLLASEDRTFSVAEVAVSGSTRALTLPAGTIPDGEARYLAYARPVSEGAYTYVYFYQPGSRNTHNQIAGWDDGAVVKIAGTDHRLIETRIQYSDVANGTVFEAGDAATEPVTPVVPATTATRYLLAGEDDTFSAAEVIVSGTDTALVVPDGTVPDGETRWFAYARIAGAGSYRHAYLYPADFPNTLNQIGAFVEGPELEIDGVAYLLLRARVDYSALVNTRVLECD